MEESCAGKNTHVLFVGPVRRGSVELLASKVLVYDGFTSFCVIYHDIFNSAFAPNSKLYWKFFVLKLKTHLFWIFCCLLRGKFAPKPIEIQLMQNFVLLCVAYLQLLIVGKIVKTATTCGKLSARRKCSDI